MIGGFTTQDQQTSVKQFIDNFVKNKPALKWAKEKIFWRSAEELEAEKKMEMAYKETIERNYQMSEEIGNLKAKAELSDKRSSNEVEHLQEVIMNLESESTLKRAFRNLANFLPDAMLIHPKIEQQDDSRSK